MKCTHCGEFIYKGRKFNARKETTEEKYYNIAVFRFYIRCTRCSGEITFKTDPKNMDYESERGAKRNFEPWREAKLNQETEEETLDRIEREEAERDAMKELEAKTVDAKVDMAVEDALLELQSRNARLEKADKDVVPADVQPDPADDERRRQEEEDAEYARQVFARRVMPDLGEEIIEEEIEESAFSPPVATTFTRKPKRDLGAVLGIKKKAPAPVPTKDPATAPAASSAMLIAGYDSDDD